MKRAFVYEDTHNYRLGCFYLELSLLLMDKNTRISDLTELAAHYGVDHQIVFRLAQPVPAKKQESRHAE